MSRILNRPMFRGGGKVSSYGNGITTGLADGGMPDKRGLVDGPGGYAGEYKFAETGLGKTLGGIGAIRPAFYDMFNTIANKGSEYLTGYNPGLSYNKQLRSERDIKDQMMNRDPLKRSDRMTDEEVDYTNFLFMKPNAKTGFTTPSMQEEKPEIPEENKISAAELALKKQNEALTAQLEAFLTPQTKKDTKKESIAKIKEKQELLEEVMGGGKSARIADASDMALSFASKALGEGATVKSAFADFLGDESKRPSRSQKVKDAAANAAIQSYLTEQMSEKDFNTKMQVIMGQQNIISAAKKKELKNMSMAEIGATSRETGSKKKQETAQRYLDIRSDDIGTKFVNNTNSKKIPVETLFVKENIGEYFLDDSTDEFFEIVILENGEIGKERRG